jgi:hypothetical protein
MDGSLSLYQPLWNGISNWKAVWNRRVFNRDDHSFDVLIGPEDGQSVSDTDMWRRPGFWKHASEFWLLSRILLDRMVSSQRGAEAAETLSGSDNTRCEVEPHMLDEYDETSLIRINGFIRNFQALKTH